MTLADLAAAFVDARAAASLTAAFSVDSVPPRTCRYCGKYRGFWAGGKTDGHARCLVGIGFQREVLALYRSGPAVTVRQIAQICGVTAENVTAWMRNADRKKR